MPLPRGLNKKKKEDGIEFKDAPNNTHRSRLDVLCKPGY